MAMAVVCSFIKKSNDKDEIVIGDDVCDNSSVTTTNKVEQVVTKANDMINKLLGRIDKWQKE
jgi:hypothetical protein